GPFRAAALRSIDQLNSPTLRSLLVVDVRSVFCNCFNFIPDRFEITFQLISIPMGPEDWFVGL
ncbi:MAG: hypothetical protein ACREP9_00480, partial [Candidatus Dormibacteraceae bacterium]